MNRVINHFEGLRSTLLSMYEDSKSASHTVVTGALREAFIRSVLENHLPSTASWSTGQIVGHAPNNDLSGQLDLILHSGELPQIHIHDGFIRLVPSDACISVIEVKSEITTGKATNPKPTDVLSGALSSMVGAKDVPRSASGSVGAANACVPFHIVAFTTKVSASKVIQAIYAHLSNKGKLQVDYWPESIVVLKGAKKTEPKGYGIFKDNQKVSMPKSAIKETLTNPIQGLSLTKVAGWEALAVLVALLANDSAAFPSSSFRLEKYIY
ncbi:DUF6602 domain-containing protein [Pectobacterium polonicum]|uniref:DUF6602 domain-containing protein n=1 Tax=Pectobacterium polonicum TaxID=2485124 RepID=UPI0010F81A64|nr:DUF6602 domain-containing protein [Pectobacterium polonicum]TKY84010.1 hypothetical protein EDI29_04660 [Pectobacterium polonicum]